MQSQTNRKWWTLGAVCVATFMLLARHHGGQHRPARDPEGPRRQLHRPAVGDRRLRSLAGRARPHRRLAGRPPRPPPRLRDRPRDLRRRLAALRARARPDLAQRRPRPAGHRRRGHVRRLPRPGRPGVPQRARTGHGDGHLRGDDRHRRGDRPAGRRPAHRRLRLGVGLPDQRADRPGGDRRHLLEAGRVPRPQRDPDRLGRPAHLLHGALRAGAGAGARQRRGLGQRPDRLPLRRRCGADGGLRRRSSAGSASRCCRSACSAAAPSPACSWRPSRSPARCSRCSST